MGDLYPHQVEGMEMLRGSLRKGKRRPLLQAPTGAGKTRIASEMIRSAAGKGKRAVFVAPALSLIDQTVERFLAEGIHDVGVIQADHWMTDPTKPVQVASEQTLARRDFPDTDLVIVDEAHRKSRAVERWMQERPTLPFIGLSATPWARGLGKVYDDLVVVCTTGDLIEKGFLSPFRVFAPSKPDLEGVRTKAGEFHEGDLAERMNKPTIVADVVTTWLERGESRPTLVFAVDRAHAKELQKQFIAAGVPTGYIDAYTNGHDRKVIERQFNAGTMKVVVNVGCLTTGVDWDVRCIVLARPTKSEMLHCQIIGRGLRIASGKADCIILDHADNHVRLGFVTDIHHDELDLGKAKKKPEPRDAPLPKECPECAYVRPAKVSVCPNCGHAAKAPGSDVEVIEGELVEMSSHRKRGKETDRSKATRAEKQLWWSSILGICAERGRSPGWAAHVYRERFTVWPRGLDDFPAEHPAPAVRSWVRSRDIAYAKRKKREAA